MEHQMNGKDQAALTACIPQSLAGGIFIYKADEGETLLYASDYVIGFFGCASYEELADYVHHSFRGMVDLRDRELVEQNIRQQTASDVCQTSYARYRVIACDGTVRYAEHFSRKVTLPGVGEVYYVFIADYDRKYLTSDIDNMTGLPGTGASSSMSGTSWNPVSPCRDTAWSISTSSTSSSSISAMASPSAMTA